MRVKTSAMDEFLRSAERNRTKLITTRVGDFQSANAFLTETCSNLSFICYK